MQKAGFKSEFLKEKNLIEVDGKKVLELLKGKKTCDLRLVRNSTPQLLMRFSSLFDDKIFCRRYWIF